MNALIWSQHCSKSDTVLCCPFAIVHCLVPSLQLRNTCTIQTHVLHIFSSQPTLNMLYTHQQKLKHLTKVTTITVVIKTYFCTNNEGLVFKKIPTIFYGLI